MSTAALPAERTPTASLLSASDADLVAWINSRGLPKYRVGQIRDAVFRGRAATVEEITTLPKRTRGELADAFTLFPSAVIRHQRSADGTEKLLLRLHDGETVETVLMREQGTPGSEGRRTVCVSSQVGCAMGCVFCASGLQGVKRNLTAAEILEQALRIDRLLKPGERLTNVVVMGLGEPMANLRELRPALDALCDPDRYGLSPRRVTVSTVGLPRQMDEFRTWDRPFNLAVSLHAPNDRLRSEIVPVNTSTGIAAILKAADDYFAATGRRITYEYVLLAGVNDGEREAAELAQLLKGRNAHVNLIPMNPVEATGLTGTDQPRTHAFLSRLRRDGVQATVRKRKGADIDAACGQLRLKSQEGAASAAGTEVRLSV